MSTPEPTDSPVENIPQKEPLNLGSAILSFIVPGLGQLGQGRGEEFFWHLLLFLLSALIPYGAIGCYLYAVSFYMSPLELLPALLLLPIPLLTVLLSVLDAACWKPGESPRFLKAIKRLAIGFIVFYVGFMVFYIALILFLPAVSSAREATRRTQCTNNIKQIGLAFHTYHDRYHSFPPAYTVDADGKPLHSWRVLILPFLDKEELYAKIRLDEPWDSEHNRQFHETAISVYRCPSDGIFKTLKAKFPLLRASGNCYYSVVTGEKTIFPGDKALSLSALTDGPSNTILVVERMIPVCWMDPMHEISFETAILGVNRELMGIGSGHIGGCNVGLADGSMHYLSETVKPEILEAALTRDGGESALF